MNYGLMKSTVSPAPHKRVPLQAEFPAGYWMYHGRGGKPGQRVRSFDGKRIYIIQPGGSLRRDDR